MSASINIKKTNRFIDPALYIAFGATGLILLGLIASAFFEKVLFSKTVSVSEEEVVKIEALKLEPQLIGALRIDATASIPTNRWVIYEIQLLDKQGKLIASATKEAWRESGYDEGNWSENDLDAGLDVRAKKNEEVTLAISVLEKGSASRFITPSQLGIGTPTPKPSQPVRINVKVANGVVDTRHLWPGLFGTSALAIMTFIAAPLNGKKVISKTVNDSDPSERATLGGADKLVRVKIKVTSDETSPRSMQARLVINDSYGEQLYSDTIPLDLTFHREEGKLEKVTGFAQKFFVLETQDSYGFHVEVIPDAPVDVTTLTVLDGNRTRTPVEAVHIGPTSS
ncbi:hypothetical protein NIES267_34170 [Calothrix parasitica NIES-267]|uniref:Uncharacterized protein n=1 Tax=Calothrix parasitica NIES-267 TaxID=1973488 RepID=A0A1Z4LRQ8_9CYAN|nr:hypothetical protein NIES267_34170 [Calothrix parasitica NIES-267]